jgi:hypothetical protein
MHLETELFFIGSIFQVDGHVLRIYSPVGMRVFRIAASECGRDRKNI